MVCFQCCAHFEDNCNYFCPASSDEDGDESSDDADSDGGDADVIGEKKKAAGGGGSKRRGPNRVAAPDIGTCICGVVREGMETLQCVAACGAAMHVACLGMGARELKRIRRSGVPYMCPKCVAKPKPDVGATGTGGGSSKVGGGGGGRISVSKMIKEKSAAAAAAAKKGEEDGFQCGVTCNGMFTDWTYSISGFDMGLWE